MSTQLILYPQDYQGYSYSTQVNTGNFASNSFFTSDLTNVGSVYGVGQIVDYGPLVTSLGSYGSGGWTGFYSDTNGSFWNTPPNTPVPYPRVIATGLELRARKTTAPWASICGVAQEITGLTIGATYQLKWSGSASIMIKWRIGSVGGNNEDFIGNNGGVFSTVIQNTSPNKSINFTATAASMPLFLAAQGVGSGVTNTLTSIEVIGTVSEVHTVAEGDGQVICDLYEEENIPLTLNVDDFTNAIEKPQSYSKSFDLPGTKRNNKIFTHIFDITKTIETAYDFNPYNQTRAVLKQNGVVIFDGTLRLLEIIDKEGEISYNVNLYSSSIALKEVLADRKLSDLTQVFSELNHSYQFTNIENSWNGILDLTNPLPTDTFAGTAGASTTAVLKYPFIDWKGNIDCTGTEPNVNNLEQAFRPCISVLYIIRNIFRQAGFEYTSSFFDFDANFANLYMDFNWGSNNAPDTWVNNVLLEFTDTTTIWSGTSATIVQFPDTTSAGNNAGWDSATHTFTCIQDNTKYSFHTDCTFYNPTSDNPLLEVWWEKNGTPISATYQSHQFLGTGKFIYSITSVYKFLDNGDTLKMVSKSSLANKVKQYGSGFGYGDNFISIVFVSNNETMISGTLVNTLRGELGQWDFLKSIMTMFNLISMPDPEDISRILIEPYPDVFGKAAKVDSTTRDWTYKLDTKDLKLEPLELKKQVVFKYSEDEEDYAFKVYKEAASGYLYGSFTLDGTSLIGSQVTLLTGEEVIEPKSFAATICKPIQDAFPNFIIPVIYSGADDGTFEGFENMPRLLLWNGIATDTWECPLQNGVAGGTKTEFGQMSHVSAVPSTATDFDMNFGACATFLGSPPVNNIYSIYYEEYFDELYNPNTRTLTAKINLSPADINVFRWYDKIFIRNRLFRVNKIDYIPNSLAKVEFILIP
jgi:hypothetical protein|tara:strand:- start:55 stop:2817 length:2763 start_codon:yes stop_codon:yes gene_type:complete